MSSCMPGGHRVASKWMNSGAGSEKSLRKSAPEVARNDGKHAQEESHAISPGRHPDSQKKHDRGVAKCHRIPAVTHAHPLQNIWISLVNAAKRCRKRGRRGLTCRFACPGGTAASKWTNSGAGSEKFLRKPAPEVTRNDGIHARDGEDSHEIGPGSHPESQKT